MFWAFKMSFNMCFRYFLAWQLFGLLFKKLAIFNSYGHPDIENSQMAAKKGEFGILKELFLL
jgi:hypothetical protein